MNIQVLGSGGAFPTLERALTSVAVQSERGRSLLLFDCGEGTQRQILKSTFRPGQVDTVCITHGHIDHCLGLPGLIARYHILGREKPMMIFGTGAVLDFLHETLRTLQMNPRFELLLTDIEKTRGPLDIKGTPYRLSWTPLEHRVPSYAFRVTDLDEGSSVIFCGDNTRPDLLKGFAAADDLLIHEATFLADIAQEVINRTLHSSVSSISAFAESEGIRNLILMHFSPRYRKEDRDLFKRDAAAVYNGKTVIAEDLDLFRFRKGLLEKI